MRRIKNILFTLVLTIIGLGATGCGSIVYDDRPCPPPSSHVYVVGPSRYYYPSGHPYYGKPYYRPAPPPPKPQNHGGPGNGRRPPTKR